MLTLAMNRFLFWCYRTFGSDENLLLNLDENLQLLLSILWTGLEKEKEQTIKNDSLGYLEKPLEQENTGNWNIIE
jgi:hypothetical protein